MIVTEGEALPSIVTDGDLALAALVRGLDADDVIDSLMTSPVITVDVTDDIHVAYRTFRTAATAVFPAVTPPPLPFSWIRNGASGLRFRHDFPPCCP
ncbi:hypothetical protein [Streptomyces sp. NPDC003943]